MSDADLVKELRRVRTRGAAKLRILEVPALTSAAQAMFPDSTLGSAVLVAKLLGAAVERLGEGPYGRAAAYLLGLEGDTRGLEIGERRSRAAEELEVMSTETFRTRREIPILEDVAQQIVLLLDEKIAVSRPLGRGGTPNTDGLAVSISYPLREVTLDGDYSAWALARTKASSRAYPIPLLPVSLHDGSPSEWLSLQQSCLRTYKLSLEDLVPEIIRLTIEHFRWYYHETHDSVFGDEATTMAKVVESVLRWSWSRDIPNVSTMTFYCRLHGESKHGRLEFAAIVPSSQLDRTERPSDSDMDRTLRLQSQVKPLSYIPWHVYIWWVPSLDPAVVQTRIIPGILARWLEARAHGFDGDEARSLFIHNWELIPD